MFGWKKKRNDSKMTLDDVMSKLRPDLSRESLGVGPDFPGVAPNPLMSSDARKRNAELRTGALALGVLVDWREVNSNPRVVLMFDVETVFLYPWAVVVKQFGPMALVSIGFFLLVLVFGLAYAWRKGALEWK